MCVLLASTRLVVTNVMGLSTTMLLRPFLIGVLPIKTSNLTNSAVGSPSPLLVPWLPPVNLLPLLGMSISFLATIQYGEIQSVIGEIIWFSAVKSLS